MKQAAEGMAVEISDAPIPIRYNNQGAIKLISSGVIWQNLKHIYLKYHCVHDKQVKGAVKFYYITSEANPADLLMKPLVVPRHEQLLQLTGLTQFGSDNQESKYDE